MAAEEVTKFAINSTLGTKKFKPLDKIMEETIAGEKRFVVSDNFYKNIVMGTKTYNVPFERTDVIELKMKIGGSIRIKGTANFNSNVSAGIYLNGISVSTFSHGGYFFSVDVNTSAGDVLTIAGDNNVSEGATRELTLSDIKVYADIIDESFIGVTENT